MEYPLRQLLPEDYPPELREIPDIPESLWLRGELPPPDTKRLAVVGSRALSPYGREACTSLIQGLSGYPISIVSGLALGADACAHKAALGAGLHTIALPGSGIHDDAIAPRTNLGLAHDILKSGGALLSEYAPDTQAAPWRFPERNRLMVGLSHAVLVVEAGERSGTLITARLTGEYNRDLLCIPHRIGDSHGYGAHLFLRLGAAHITDPSHILEALGMRERAPLVQTSLPLLEGSERTVYEILAEPHSRDDVIRLSNLPVGDVLTALVMLELQGVVKEEFGAWRRSQ